MTTKDLLNRKGVLKFGMPLFLLSMFINANLMGQNTPLLDRELFFGNPQISGGQLSPDGKYITFLKEYEGIMNIWIKDFDQKFEEARPLTDSKRPLYGYFWTIDGKYILYIKDNDGDENMNIFAVDPSEKPVAEVPESRNLTPMKDVTAQIYHVSDKNPDLFFIGLNDRDKAWHDLYSLNISTGEIGLIYTNEDRITSYDFDWDDNLRLLYKTDEKGNTIIFYKKGDELKPIYETDVTENAGVYGWNEDNSKVYLVSNKGDLNLSTLFIMDPESMEITKFESDPENKVDFGGLRMDRNTRKIISTSYTDDKTRVYWKDKNWENNYNFLKAKFPGREISLQSSTKDYSKFLIAVWGDKYASESYFFDTKSKDLIFQYTPRPELKEVEAHLVEMQPISYKSSDGLEIPAYLSLPSGKKGKKLPMVVLVHGGPKGPRDYWGYDAQVQFLANRGYAVLQPNFRASGGYGKAFMNAGDLQWGKLMQDDITWGVKHLISEGIADPKRIAIMGGSYGGYATLAGLAFTPELYACGVDIVGPSNIFTLLESVPAYWEAGRAFLYGMVGDPNTEEGKQLIEAASPLFSADKIVKPLLIIQGANDPRVKKAEADQIAIAMRDKGKKVAYLLADDEGHGFRKPVNRMAMYAEVERFLAEVLGGRYQKDMPEDVAKRLEELRVDINSVVYVPQEIQEVVESLPEMNKNWKAATHNYDLSIEVQGQKLAMEMSREVKNVNGNWEITGKTTGPMGNSEESVTYNSDLLVIQRKIAQMGQEIVINFEEKKAVVDAMGNKMNIDFDGAFLSTGEGIDMILCSMPLKEGFEMVVNTIDMMKMAGTQSKIKYEGMEEVDGVNCLKVSISKVDNENDKSVYYLNTDLGIAEKVVTTIPAMGNAISTMSRRK